jgi:hypothetical protein
MTDRTDDEDDLPVPFGCVKSGKLVVVTQRSDLGYGRGSSGRWWALQAFSAMCDQQTELSRHYDLWTFPATIALAVERILEARGRKLTMVDEDELARGMLACTEDPPARR